MSLPCSETRTLAVLCGLVIVISVGACDPYDSPPESELILPAGGRWFKTDPVEVGFSEPVDADTLRVSIWPHALDIEGELLSDVEPLLDACTPATSPCGDVTLSLVDDGTRLVIEQGELFEGREGEPHLLEIHGGLSDLAGHIRLPSSFFDFQISPDCGGGPIALPFESGVFALSADLTHVLPGVYLRMFVDISVNPETGLSEVFGIVARVLPDFPPNTTDPVAMYPVVEDVGWAIRFQADIGLNAEGDYCFLSHPFDLDILVLGVIRVRLQSLQIEATLTARGEGAEARDGFEGYMSTVQGLLGDDDDLGAVGAAIVGGGLHPEEVGGEIPRVCSEMPCALLDAVGGDCQIVSSEEPWVLPTWCQDTMDAR